MLRLGYTILYVDSVAETVAFYERAFGLERGMVSAGNEYGEMKTGDTTLAFSANAFVRTLVPVSFKAAQRQGEAPPIELGLVTNDVEAAFARAVAAGAENVKKPETKPWGQLVGYVRDNNGFLVETCSPIAG